MPVAEAAAAAAVPDFAFVLVYKESYSPWTALSNGPRTPRDSEIDEFAAAEVMPCCAAPGRTPRYERRQDRKPKDRDRPVIVMVMCGVGVDGRSSRV